MSGRECSSGLVGHGMNDTQESIGEGHTSQALSIVHLLSGNFVSVVRSRQIFQNHFNGLQSQRIGERAVQGGNISLDGMSQSIHTGVGNLFYRKSHNQIRINDGNIRSDVEVSQRIFDAALIISDNGESSYFGSSTGSRGDGSESCFLSQLRETEGSDEILEFRIRILMESPHSLGCIDGGTSAHCHDPVRLELLHHFCASHDSLNRGIRFYAFDQLHFHAALFQVVHCAVKKALTLHGAAAYNQNSLFTFQIFQLFQTSCSMVNISR